uniref:Uncharacterized protein n=1 Tax=Anguilla anguilla TaxID=7936 RepID=A0A0E9WPX4_ANGAN
MVVHICDMVYAKVICVVRKELEEVGGKSLKDCVFKELSGFSKDEFLSSQTAKRMEGQIRKAYLLHDSMVLSFCDACILWCLHSELRNG